MPSDACDSHTTFDQSRDEQTFRVLATNYSALILIQPLMRSLGTEAPNIRIYLESRDIAEHADRLQRSEIDLAIVPERFSRTIRLPAQPILTDLFTFAQQRLVSSLEQAAELRMLQPSCAIPQLVETITWHPRSTNDPGHRWLRQRIVEL